MSENIPSSETSHGDEKLSELSELELDIEGVREAGRLREDSNLIEATIENHKGKKMPWVRAITLGLAGAGAMYATKIKTDKIEADSIAQYDTVSHELGKTDAEKTKEYLGFDLAKIAEGLDLGVKVLVPNGKGKYVILVGVAHAHPAKKWKTGLSGQFLPGEDLQEENSQKEIRARVCKSQRNNIELMKQIAKAMNIKSFEGVFEEGLGEGTFNDFLYSLRKLRQEISDINVNASGESIISYFLKIDEWLKKFSEKSEVDERERTGVVSYFRRLLIEKQKEVAQKLEKRGDKESADFLKLQVELSSLVDYAMDDELQLGAGQILVIEGLIDKLLPTETFEANQVAIKLIRECNDIFIKQKQTSGDNEYKKLGELFDLKMTEFKLAAFEPREDIAVNLILKNANKIRSQVLPMFFGDNHDFGNNVRKSARGKLGLISVSPRWRTSRKDKLYRK